MRLPHKKEDTLHNLGKYTNSRGKDLEVKKEVTITDRLKISGRRKSFLTQTNNNTILT